MLGYQGESERPAIQRQSIVSGSISQTGLPSAPAKWATEVSMVMTRSRQEIRTAESAKSLISAVRSTSGSSGGAGAPPSCKLNNDIPGISFRYANSSGGQLRLRLRRVCRPDQQIPILMPQLPGIFSRQAINRSCEAARYGTSFGNCSSDRSRICGRDINGTRQTQDAGTDSDGPDELVTPFADAINVTSASC